MTDSFTNATKVRTKLLATNTRNVHNVVALPIMFSPSLFFPRNWKKVTHEITRSQKNIHSRIPNIRKDCMKIDIAYGIYKKGSKEKNRTAAREDDE